MSHVTLIISAFSKSQAHVCAFDALKLKNGPFENGECSTQAWSQESGEKVIQAAQGTF